MKITGMNPPRTQPARRSEKAGAARDGGFGGELRGAEGGKAADGAGGEPIGAVEALLALQEVPDATTGGGSRRQRARADAILDRLEDIRLGLLAGAMPRDRLEQLINLVDSRREAVDDPGLTEVLDEIDLRARVELAKLSVRP